MQEVNAFDEYDGLTEEEKEVAQQFFTLGFEDGYDEGYETCYLEASSYAAGRDVGFQLERNRVYQICSMQMEWAEQNNKGRDYIFWKNVREVLQPKDFEPMSQEEYDQWLNE